MPEAREQAATPKPRDGSRRVYVWWGVGMGLLTLLGLFCWLIAAPYLQVLGAVSDLYDPVVVQVVSDDERLHELLRPAVERLGGPEKALSKIRLYLRMPQRLAPARQVTYLMLSECGEPAVDTLTACLWTQPNWPGSCAAWALGEIGPPAQKAIPSLVLLAAQCSDRSISDYVEPLQRIDPGGIEAVPLFIAMLESGDKDARPGAALALGRYGAAARPAVPLLIRALDNPATTRAAAMAFIRLGSEAKEAVPALVKALANEDAGVRRDAIWALGRIGPEAAEAAPALIAIVRKEGLQGDQEARYRAAAALGRLGRNAVPAMVAELEDCNEDPHPLAEALIEIGPEVVPEVIKVKDEWLGLTTVLYVLDEFGPRATPAVPWLIAKLQQPELKFGHCELVRTLGRIGPAAGGAVPVLTAALGHRIDDFRKEAAGALGRIGPDAKAALPALDGLSGDKNASVRLAASAAAWKLRSQPDKAVAALIEGLNAEATRACAISELGAMGPEAKAAGTALARFFPGSAVAYWWVTGDAYTALNALVPLLWGTDHASAGKRYLAISQLRQMGQAAAPALGWIDRATIDTFSFDRETKPWAYWHIRGIDRPPGLRSEDSDLQWPPPQPPTSAPDGAGAGTGAPEPPP